VTDNVIIGYPGIRGGSRSRDWRGPYGERGARAYNGGLGAMPPAGSRECGFETVVSVVRPTNVVMVLKALVLRSVLDISDTAIFSRYTCS